MWSCGWPQWPIQQAMYQNLPHEQVDWAALAKQWIDMQKTGEAPVSNLPVMTSNGPATSAPINTTTSVANATSGTLGESFRNQTIINPVKRPEVLSLAMTRPSGPVIMPLTKHSSENPSINAEGVASSFWDGSWDTSNSASSVGGAWTSATASVPVPPVLSDKPPFNFGDSIHGNLPLQAQSYDYNHGSDPYINQQNFSTNESPYPQYWTSSGSEALPPFLRKERIRGDENLSMNSDDMNQMCNLDAAKRKQLPIWIREGLEKMERDRQRQQEKERLKQEYEEKRANQTISGELTATDQQSKNDIKRSRFDSESEEEEQNETEIKDYSAKIPTKSHSSIKEPMTEEEMMLKVRKMLTEILLEVTNEEVNQVTREVYQRARSKAPARQLASSTALASITGAFGGLSGYGSGGSNNESEKEESNSDGENSDDELERIIMEKKNAFVFKELEIEEMLKTDENEKKEKDEVKDNQNPIQPPEIKLKSELLDEKSDPNSVSTSDSETSSDTEGTYKSSPHNKTSRVVGRKQKEKFRSSRSRSGSLNSNDSKPRTCRNKGNHSHKINSDKKRKRKSRSSSRHRSSSKSTSASRSRSRSRNGRNRSNIGSRYRNRSRSRNRKSRSRSRNRKSRSRSRNRKSRSRSRNRKSRSRSRNRKSRSRSRTRKSHSRSRNRKSQSPSRSKHNRSRSKTRSGREFKNKSTLLLSRNTSYGRSKEKSTHDFSKNKLKTKSRSPKNDASERNPDPKEKVNSDNKSHGQETSKETHLKSRRRDSGSSSSDSLQSGKKSS